MKKSGSFMRKGNVGFSFPTKKEEKKICPFCGQEIRKVRVGIGFGVGEEEICGCNPQNFTTSSRGWGSE